MPTGFFYTQTNGNMASGVSRRATKSFISRSAMSFTAPAALTELQKD